MGHYSYLIAGEHQFLYTRDHYNHELAALFNEADREFVAADDKEVIADDDWDTTACELGYYTTVKALRQRLSVQGFTSHRALADLADGLEHWRKTYDSQSELREEQARGENQFPTAVRPPREPAELLTAIGEAIRPHRPAKSFTTPRDYFQYETGFSETTSDVEELRWFMEERSLIRLIIDQAADDTRVGMDLSALTGCCVNLDTSQPIAGPTRERQLTALPDNAPLIVLVEGSSDSRLLTAAMHVTHPHLAGFVRFIDYVGTKARGGAGALPTMVNAFIAAGVANRFVAVADNDTGGHEGIAKLKRQKLPVGCQVLHYPELPLLASYPTVDSPSSTVSLTNVNGVAGSLEMYLGEDILTIDGTLTPVHLGTFIPAVGRRQGSISKSHKSLAREAFLQKVKKARLAHGDATGDWSGVRAIIDSIVHAFEVPSS
ncbi:HEPN/Toprim-associated domain-containing protein [Streptomyces sp. NPDC127038]|uniref:HEPN/Toprim-associated domain-containing protein n=1 Tax=Streptomyces sp. NPDC127038 TaxID=3347114 RepID=UPI003656B2A8